MNHKATYLFATCLFLLSIGFAQQSRAQNALGIVWQAPPDTIEAYEQLQQFSALGITHLEIDHPVSQPILELLDQSEFTILIRSGERFFTISEIEASADRLAESYLELLEQYQPHLNVAGLGLLSHSHVEHPLFFDLFEPVIKSLSSVSSTSFYFFHKEKWFSFRNPEQPFGILYPDRSYQPSDLFEFDSAIRSLNEADSNKLLFIRSSWFLEAVEQYPELYNSLKEYQDNNAWELPYPEAGDQGASANWMVLILILLWVALAIQVKYLPYVRSMILRFFFAHRFYVDDILHYRERYATSSILMMLKHAIFGGLVLYITSEILLTEHGIEAFFHHLPWLAITGVNSFSFFFFALIIIVITQLIALLWLHLPAKTLDHISQTINLYAGIFYLDFIVVTLMVTFFTAGIGSSIILALGFIYLLIWFAGFNLAAFDASKNMGAQSFLYLFLTIGLHAILSLATLLLILIYSDIFEIIDLAVSL